MQRPKMQALPTSACLPGKLAIGRCLSSQLWFLQDTLLLVAAHSDPGHCKLVIVRARGVGCCLVVLAVRMQKPQDKESFNRGYKDSASEMVAMLAAVAGERRISWRRSQDENRQNQERPSEIRKLQKTKRR